MKSENQAEKEKISCFSDNIQNLESFYLFYIKVNGCLLYKGVKMLYNPIEHGRFPLKILCVLKGIFDKNFLCFADASVPGESSMFYGIIQHFDAFVKQASVNFYIK